MQTNDGVAVVGQRHCRIVDVGADCTERRESLDGIRTLLAFDDVTRERRLRRPLHSDISRACSCGSEHIFGRRRVAPTSGDAARRTIARKGHGLDGVRIDHQRRRCEIAERRGRSTTHCREQCRRAAFNGAMNLVSRRTRCRRPVDANFVCHRALRGRDSARCRGRARTSVGRRKYCRTERGHSLHAVGVNRSRDGGGVVVGDGRTATH